MPKKIVVAGHLCLDITPELPVSENLNNFLIPGRLSEIGDADVHLGGCVANTGLGLSRLGADVTLVTRIGQDAFGTLARAQFDAFGVKTVLHDSEGKTSYSVVLAPHGIDRIILHHPGVNNLFTHADVPDEVLNGAGLFHFGYPPLMKRMYMNNGAELKKMFLRVREKGIATSLDLAGVDERTDAGRADWRAILTEVLPLVDFFEPSVEELALMLNRPLYHQWLARAAGKDLCRTLSLSEIVPLAEQALAMGARVVLLKCGAPGMYFAAGSAERLREIGGGLGETCANWAKVRGFERSYRPDCIRSGTGAGDTSIAAFLYAITLRKPWKRCVELASAAGASCLTAYDALSGLRPLPELEEKIEAGWPKDETVSDITK